MTTNGGPAFPVITSTDTVTAGPWSSDPGMTLLDYFAGQVIVASISTYGEQWGDGEAVGRQVEWAAKNAYAVAEAMLAERTRRENEKGGGNG